MTFELKKYKFEQGRHKGRNVIWIHFPNDEVLRSKLKVQFPTVQFSETRKDWYLNDIKNIREIIGMQPKSELEKLDMEQVSEFNRSALQRLHETLLQKAYSPNTVKTYCNDLFQLLITLKNTNIDALTPEQLRTYFSYCKQTLHLSENSLHSRMNSIKFYFEQVLGCDKLFFQGIPRPKSKLSLPKVLSKKEIVRIFEQVDSLKHQIVLKLCYGMGLRVSDIVNIKISDIDSERMLVHIQDPKGKNDRYVPLPKSILRDLRDYFIKYRPKEFLFEGRYDGQYSIRSVQTIFNTAMKKAKIKKTISIHGLRHSYAAHLLEAGTDMVYIKKLLGNKDTNPNQRYAKVSEKKLQRIKSPLDSLSESQQK